MTYVVGLGQFDELLDCQRIVRVLVRVLLKRHPAEGFLNVGHCRVVC